MTTKVLDFSKIEGFTLDRRKPGITEERFARPCPENSSLREFLRTLPAWGSTGALRELVRLLASIKRAGRPLLFGIGSEVLAEGLSPVLIDLLQRSLISAVALTGEAVYRDVEIAMTGGLCEEIGTEPRDFFQTRETTEIINDSINFASLQGPGLGEALGARLKAAAPYEHLSLLAAAHAYGIPATVHLTIGAEAAHVLPTASGEAIGRTAHRDFRTFAALVANLQGGVYINSGAEVVLPRIFLRALLAVRALGHRVDDFSIVELGGEARLRQENWQDGICGERVSHFRIDGACGLLYPLVTACLLDELSENC